MKNRIFYMMTVALTSSVFTCHLGYTSDRGRASLSQSDQDIIKETEAGHEGAAKRTKKRSEGRKLQRQGEEFEKNVTAVAKPVSKLGTVVGLGAAATGDPHAKMAAAAFKFAIVALEEGGKGIGKIVQAVGRYQERSQEILSNAEIFLESIQKSLDNIKDLEKKRKDLLSVEKPIEPSESSSRLKQLTKGAQSAIKTAEIKVRQATDVLTDAKAERGEKLKVIEADLKVENENYAENIRMLEILLLQNTIAEAKKKIDIEGTIDALESKLNLYQVTRADLSKNKSKRKKKLAEIEKEEAIINKDLLYYMKFQKSPTETPEELEKYLSELQNTSDELTALTKKGDMRYLQEREIDLDSEVNRAAIVGLYKEIDAIKSQLEALGKTVPTKDMGGTGPKQSLETAKSQKDATPKVSQEPTKDKGNAVGSFSKEAIIEQRKNLRPLLVPSQETRKGG